ncbi:unnamed protein product [Prunus armeniaca]|uniref:Uncharacterized protein n=1 Tax=Prunus armeniaca TaxID=36596 RepID=A0A6J5UM59_PRUAR|nr:unnamed protein product [Prunus armeniaca]
MALWNKSGFPDILPDLQRSSCRESSQDSAKAMMRTYQRQNRHSQFLSHLRSNLGGQRRIGSERAN